MFADERVSEYNVVVKKMESNQRSQPGQTSIDVPANVKNKLACLFSAHPQIVKVVVFGSRARGEADERVAIMH